MPVSVPATPPLSAGTFVYNAHVFEDTETVLNPHAEAIEVWFEPWGMSHALPPGQSFRVVAISEQEGRLEVERAGPRVAVYGWPGSTMRVYCGDRFVADFSNKFPELPPGMSSKSFVRSMFGGPGGPSGRLPVTRACRLEHWKLLLHLRAAMMAS